MPESLHLSIVKYSYSPDFLISSEEPVASENKAPWTTIGTANMTIVIEPTRFGLINASNPGLCLKIVHECKVLELVQLQHLCEAATTAPWNRKPIRAVVQSPRLALSYHLDDEYERRLQVRFATDAEFNSAVAVLENLRCPISGAVNRPRTANQKNNPGHAPSNEFLDRPTTAGSAGSFTARKISTPVQDHSTTSQGSYFGSVRVARDPTINDDRETQTSSQSHIRPSTAPIIDTDLISGNRSYHLSRGGLQSGGQYSSQSQSQSTSSRDNAQMPSTVSELPPLPTPTLVRKISQLNMPWSHDGRIHQSGEERWSDSLGSKKAAHLQTSPLTRSYLPDNDVPSSESANIPSNQESDPLWQLRDYAARPNAERQALVDSLLCRYINNDGFLRLCEDVENSWRRIGFDATR